MMTATSAAHLTAIAQPPVIRGLPARETLLLDLTTRILDNAADGCMVETRTDPRLRKTEQKTSYVIGDIEIVRIDTTYAIGVHHHELRIIQHAAIKFLMVYDNTCSDRTTKIIIDESRQLEVVLRKIILEQEKFPGRTTR